jgi:hypothetical protein
MLSLLRKHVFDSSCLGNLCCCGNVFIRLLPSKWNLLLCEWPAPELMRAVLTKLYNSPTRSLSSGHCERPKSYLLQEPYCTFSSSFTLFFQVDLPFWGFKQNFKALKYVTLWRFQGVEKINNKLIQNFIQIYF